MEKVLDYAKVSLEEKGVGLVIANLSSNNISCYYATEGGYWWKIIENKYPDILKKKMNGDIPVYDEGEGVMYLFDEYGLMIERSV